MKYKKLPYKELLLLIFVILIASCSVEKNTNLSRFYHNLTSHYNIYFNGQESYLKGMERIASSNTDDYSTIMPLFEFSNPDVVKSAASDMDRAMQKASKVISLHSMTAKPERKSNKPLTEKEKELLDRNDYNNWVDDSYLLLGKAQFMKHDFENARVTFLHNIRESEDRSMRIESQIWLIRTYSGLNNFGEALRISEEMENTDMSDQNKSELLLSKADLFIKQERFNDAIAPLSSSIGLMKGNYPKNRYTYILARLNEEVGNTYEAEKAYKAVLKLSPPYELEFNARINQAGVFDVESGDIDDIKRELKRLLKDVKNAEYQDQIYFALGNLSMREGDVEKAIEYIQMSAMVSTVNTNQKGRSYLMLAEHYFKNNEYLKSQIYYDSTVNFLDSNYPGFDKINEISLNLNLLAENINTVNREDSLQYVASLPEAQQQSLISSIISELENKERLEEAQLDDRYNMGQFYENQRRFRDNTTDVSGKWYFYNQAALTFGRTEFRNRWGQRKLEDNWRRKNKARVNSIGMTEIEGGEIADTIAAITDIKSPEYYLKDLPLTDSLMAISHDRVATSLFNAARIFSDKFEDLNKSNERYEELLSRYPDNILIPQALFNLYNINRNTNTAVANRNKDILLSRYPESEYAKIVSNPDYYEMLREEMKKEENLYNKAYDEWVKGNFNSVIEICDEGIRDFQTGELLAKFNLLRAFSLAQSVDERTFKAELQKIKSDFPGTEEAKRASELIDYINQEIPELKIEEEMEIAKEIYNSEISGPHHFVVIIKNKDLDLNRLTFDVINFNIDNYTNENYSTRGELVNNDYIMIVVSTLADEYLAADYYNNFDYTKILNNIGNTKVETFTITLDNMEIFSRDKDPNRYLLFFNENYLTPGE